MRYTNPDNLDYDQEIYASFAGQPRDFLIRFFNYFVDNIENRERGFSEDTGKTADDLAKIIAADLSEVAKEFLALHEKIRREGIRLNTATQYLAEHYDIAPEDLDFSSGYDLLLTLYEYELVVDIEDIIVGIDIRRNAWKRSFVLNEYIQFDNLDDKLEAFHEFWNSKQENRVPTRVILERIDVGTATLRIHREKQSGSNIIPTFTFRDQGGEGVPTKPEVGQVEVYEIKTLLSRIEPDNGRTKLTFTEDPSHWKSLLDGLFESVFDISDISRKIRPERVPEVEDVETEFERGIESDEDPLGAAQGVIQSRKQEAKSEVEKKGLPPSKTDKLKEIIETVEIGGSDIEDDPSINTTTFRLVGELPEMFRAVDIETGFKDMLETADPDKRSFVIRINNKAVALENGRWRKLDPGSLGDLERQALEILFSGNVTTT